MSNDSVAMRVRKFLWGNPLLALIGGLVLSGIITQPLFAFEFTPKIIHNDKEFYLNGVGTKDATFLALKVYEVALYLTSRTKKSKEILARSGPAVFELKFMRNVRALKLSRGWIQDLYAACPNEKSLIEKAGLLADQLPDVRKGELVQYAVDENNVIVHVGGKLIGKLVHPRAGFCVLSVFIGEGVSTDESLRNSLLGLDSK